MSRLEPVPAPGRLGKPRPTKLHSDRDLAHVGQPFLDFLEARLADGEACWEWDRNVGHRGVPRVGVRLTDAPRPTLVAAHRVAWVILEGPLTPGLVLHRRCGNVVCVNPLHMEELTARENTLRGESAPAENAGKDTCPRGHALGGDNVAPWRVRTDGARSCLTCERDNTDRKNQLITRAARAAGLGRREYLRRYGSSQGTAARIVATGGNDVGTEAS